MPIYTNADGLQLAFGNEQGRANRAGFVQHFGARNMLKLEIVLKDLPVGQNVRIPLFDNTILGAGYLITRVTATATEAAVGGGTLDVGLGKMDGTELDWDGFIAAAANTSFNAQGKTATGAGALVNGPALTVMGVPYARVNTTAYTAGKIEVLVEYKPTK